MPIWVPSGLQTSVPGELQDDDPAAAGADPDELEEEVLPGATAGAAAALGAAEATGGATAGTLDAGAEPEADGEPAPAAKTPPEDA